MTNKNSLTLLLAGLLLSVSIAWGNEAYVSESRQPRLSARVKDWSQFEQNESHFLMQFDRHRLAIVQYTMEEALQLTDIESFVHQDPEALNRLFNFPALCDESVLPSDDQNMYLSRVSKIVETQRALGPNFKINQRKSAINFATDYFEYLLISKNLAQLDFVYGQGIETKEIEALVSILTQEKEALLSRNPVLEFLDADSATGGPLNGILPTLKKLQEANSQLNLDPSVVHLGLSDWLAYINQKYSSLRVYDSVDTFKRQKAKDAAFVITSLKPFVDSIGREGIHFERPTYLGLSSENLEQELIEKFNELQLTILQRGQRAFLQFCTESPKDVRKSAKLAPDILLKSVAIALSTTEEQEAVYDDLINHYRPAPWLSPHTKKAIRVGFNVALLGVDLFGLRTAYPTLGTFLKWFNIGSRFYVTTREIISLNVSMRHQDLLLFHLMDQKYKRDPSKFFNNIKSGFIDLTIHPLLFVTLKNVGEGLIDKYSSSGTSKSGDPIVQNSLAPAKSSSDDDRRDQSVLIPQQKPSEGYANINQDELLDIVSGLESALEVDPYNADQETLKQCQQLEVILKDESIRSVTIDMLGEKAIRNWMQRYNYALSQAKLPTALRVLKRLGAEVADKANQQTPEPIPVLPAPLTEDQSIQNRIYFYPNTIKDMQSLNRDVLNRLPKELAKISGFTTYREVFVRNDSKMGKHAFGAAGGHYRILYIFKSDKVVILKVTIREGYDRNGMAKDTCEREARAKQMKLSDMVKYSDFKEKTGVKSSH